MSRATASESFVTALAELLAELKSANPGLRYTFTIKHDQAFGITSIEVNSLKPPHFYLTSITTYRCHFDCLLCENALTCRFEKVDCR